MNPSPSGHVERTDYSNINTHLRNLIRLMKSPYIEDKVDAIDAHRRQVEGLIDNGEYGAFLSEVRNNYGLVFNRRIEDAAISSLPIFLLTLQRRTKSEKGVFAAVQLFLNLSRARRAKVLTKRAKTRLVSLMEDFVETYGYNEYVAKGGRNV